MNQRNVRRAPIALLALALPFTALGTDAQAQIATREIDLTVRIDDHKPSGDAWDAFGGAPDVAICVSSALGRQCFAAGSGIYNSPAEFGRARCQDSTRCSFDFRVPATGPFRLEIYDVDVSDHDFVGSCAVTPDGNAFSGRCGSARVTVR